MLDRDVKETNFAIAIQFGFPPQKILIKNLSVSVYDTNIPFEKLPKTKVDYEGSEPNALWRTNALKRIDSLRKGNIEISFTQNGKELKNNKVNINLVKHHFRWGAALRAQDIVSNPALVQAFSSKFNYAVLENDLKIKSWSNPKNRLLTLQALEILKSHKILIKGHVLLWPGYRHLTTDYRKLTNANQIIEQVQLHVNDITSMTAPFIFAWDVVNELYTNKDLQHVAKSDQVVFDPFIILKSKLPNVKRYINEYGILSQGGLNKDKQRWYFDYIQTIDKNTGKAVDGIGMQSHIGTDLTPPSKVLSILDYYAPLQKKIAISEFTLDIDDEYLRYQYTKDFITAVFSHPNVDEFLFWGLVGDVSSKVDIFKKDFKPGSMGKAFDELVHVLWKTSAEKITDESGKIKLNGFFGTYKYTVHVKGKKYEGQFDLKPGAPKKINIQI